jgi:hypothetical protein
MCDVVLQWHCGTAGETRNVKLSLKGEIAIATKHLSASTASSKKQQQATIKQRTSALSPKNGDIGYIY